MVLALKLIAGVIMTDLKLLNMLTHLVYLLIESLSISFKTGHILDCSFILFDLKIKKALVLIFDLAYALSGDFVRTLRCIELGTNSQHLFGISS